MIKSMQSGVSGLMVHKTKMDVIANNIANVNTNVSIVVLFQSRPLA